MTPGDTAYERAMFAIAGLGTLITHEQYMQLTRRELARIRQALRDAQKVR